MTHSTYGFLVTLDPAVYPSHPDVTYSSAMVIEALPADLRGQQILDVGTGCGVVAIAAALRGATVTACDNDLAALTLARLNAEANGVSANIHFIESELLTAVEVPAEAERFDLITANLWFPIKLWGFRHQHAELMAIQRQFLKTVRDVLKPGGQVYLASAAFADVEGILRLFAEARITPEIRRHSATHGTKGNRVEWLLFVFGYDHAS
ncbi:methyltransferase [Asticcacaulis excentricus]|uniref:methyltransferase n=1 Tax=Asticcacaulis excentricus TaxID=78587 RepID=UPI0015622E16|nr:methyltransferase [Asticcacaulis excentricus]